MVFVAVPLLRCCGFFVYFFSFLPYSQAGYTWVRGRWAGTDHWFGTAEGTIAGGDGGPLLQPPSATSRSWGARQVTTRLAHMCSCIHPRASPRRARVRVCVVCASVQPSVTFQRVILWRWYQWKSCQCSCDCTGRHESLKCTIVRVLLCARSRLLQEMHPAPNPSKILPPTPFTCAYVCVCVCLSVCTYSSCLPCKPKATGCWCVRG